MKKVALTIALWMSLLTANSQDKTSKIDFDYKKIWNISMVGMDYNQNGTPDDDEISFPAEGSMVYVEYKHFGDAGSLLYLEIFVKGHKGGKQLTIKGNLNDVIFLHKVKDGGDGIVAYNKLGELQFVIANIEGDKSIWVANPAFLIER